MQVLTPGQELLSKSSSIKSERYRPSTQQQIFLRLLKWTSFSNAVFVY
jgi:hypothetical protein